jgi:hypothetical protein
MQSELITVKTHPDNPGGFAIYKGSEMVNTINQNWFIDYDHAIQVARSYRHVIYLQAVNELFDKLNSKQPISVNK